MSKENYVPGMVEFIYPSPFGNKYQCLLSKAKYYNGRLAIQLLESEDSSPIAVVTVNIPEVELKEDEIIVKDYSENEGMSCWLVDNGLAAYTGKGVYTGFVRVPIMRLTEKAKEILQ